MLLNNTSCFSDVPCGKSKVVSDGLTKSLPLITYRNCWWCKQISANLRECTFIDTLKLCTQEFIGDKTVWLAISQELAVTPVTPGTDIEHSTTWKHLTGVFWRTFQHSWEQEEGGINPLQVRHWGLPWQGTEHRLCMAVRLKARANLKSAKREQKGKVRVCYDVKWFNKHVFNFFNLCWTLEIALLNTAAGAQQNSSTHCTKSDQRHSTAIGGLR